MVHKNLWVSVLLLTGALFVATSSFAQSDVVEQRQKLMKQQGATAKALNAAVKSNDFATVELKAKDLAQSSEKIPALFPKGSTTGTTRATNAIWEKNDDFKAAAKKLNTVASELAAAAKSGDAEAVGAKTKALPGTCDGCHDAFRAPRN